jgi:hypothetical protein
MTVTSVRDGPSLRRRVKDKEVVADMPEVASLTDPEARTERRLRVLVQIILYPMAIGLIVIGLHRSQANSDPSATALTTLSWRGLTDQHQEARMSIREGQAVAFTTTVRLQCENGSRPRFRLRLSARQLVQRGTYVWVNLEQQLSSGLTVVASLSAMVGPDINGAVQAHSRPPGPGSSRPFSCEAYVPFALRRQ